MKRGLCLAALCVVACRHETKPSVSFAPLAAEFAGCAAVLAGEGGSVCELPKDRTIRVFVPGTVTATFSAPATELRAFPDGRLHRVVVPEGATSLTVEKEGKRFVLPLAKDLSYPWIHEARAMRGKDPEGARTKAKEKLASKDPTERALALGLIARLDLAKGDVEPAIARFREAIGLHTVRLSDKAEDSFALAFALNQRTRRYAEARAVLDGVMVDAYPEGRALLPFYRAELALETGDLRATVGLVREASSAAERLGTSRIERSATSLLATVQQGLGRPDDGIATLRALDVQVSSDPTARGCERAEILLNLAISLERRDRAKLERGEPAQADELTAVANRAKALFPETCADPHLRTLVFASAAAAALGRGDAKAAADLVAEAKPKQPRSTETVYFLDLEARVATAQKDHTRAQALYAQEMALADAAQFADVSWRARVGRAESLAAAGDEKGALEGYAAAEKLLDDSALALPIGESRVEYLLRTERSARLAIALNLKRNDASSAFSVARRAHARLLTAVSRTTALDALDPAARKIWEDALATFRARRATLDAESANDWSLSAAALHDAQAARTKLVAEIRGALDTALSALGQYARGDGSLVEPGEGELWLSFHSVGHQVVAFAATRGSTRAVIVTEGDILAPFAKEIRAARRVAVLAETTGAVDVHARDFDGAPLIETVPVVYALDVPRRRAPSDAALTGIVGDPTSDLAEANAEAKRIEALFAEKGRPTQSLLGPAATSNAVLAMLPTVGVFHYAGHGLYAGLDGTESRLPLAAGTQLGVLDVLASPHVPRLVVLSACETATGSLETQSLGLAPAFILAGSEGVVAPTRKVTDALASAFAIALHQALLGGDEWSVAVRRAQRALRAQNPASDWAVFRAIRP